MKKLLLLLPFLIFISSANAQITLKPGNATFSIDSITLSGQGIELQNAFNPTGTSYLNVYWNSFYMGGSNETIGATCYLNCIPETQNCSSAQQCNHTAYPGPSVCTIFNPDYKFTDIDNVTCKFFNPQFPLIEYSPYPYKDFYSIKFEVSYSNLTTTVGEEARLQINVKNIGLFTDNYTVKIVYYPENIIAIDSKTLESTIGPLKGSSYQSTPETDSTYVNFVIMAEIGEDANICFTVNSTSKPDANTFYDCVRVRSSLASLPDFNFLGIIWIMIISSVLILKNKTF